MNTPLSGVTLCTSVHSEVPLVAASQIENSTFVAAVIGLPVTLATAIAFKGFMGRAFPNLKVRMGLEVRQRPAGAGPSCRR